MLKRITLLLMLMAMVVLPQVGLAEDDAPEYECYCNLKCRWYYYILNPICVGEHGNIYIIYQGSTNSQLGYEQQCESQEYAFEQCRQKTASKVYDELNQKEQICPDAQIPLFGNKTPEGTEDRCIFQKKGCSFVALLGEADPRLDTLRQFRDTVLSKSTAGRAMIKLYYEYSNNIIQIFETNPAIKAQAQELAEQVIPQVDKLLRGETSRIMVTDEMIAHTDSLIAELEVVMGTPLQEKLKSVKDAMVKEKILTD